MTQKFRVLSLSGGGIRGVFTASFLAKLETLTNSRLLDHFDLLVGTSTGGLVALAMGLEQSPESVRDFYLEHGNSIFPKQSLLMRLVRQSGVFRPAHDINGLRQILKARFGSESLLGHSKKALVINTFNAAKGTPQSFKTRHHVRYKNDWQMPAWEVGVATSAAPIYLGAFQAPTGTDYIDGGVWANCPVLVGIIEAMTAFGRRPEEIEVLSIGTTRSAFSVSHPARSGGGWHFMKNGHLIDLLFEANRAAAMNMSSLLLGGSLMEIDEVVAHKRFSLDNCSSEALRDLRAIGEHLAQKNADEIHRRFLFAPTPMFTPIPVV